MVEGTLRLTLRPIRFAMLVDPNDRGAILDAIRINTFLWGGAFNPIIPVPRRAPRVWKERFSSVTAKEMVAGLVRAFDPDLVVAVGELATPGIDLGQREVIRGNDVLGDFEEDLTPAYGIGIFEVVDHLIREELRFVRRQPLQFGFPEFGDRGGVFLSAVFGDLVAPAKELFCSRYEAPLDLRRDPCNTSNHASFLNRNNLFLRRLGSLYVDLSPRARFRRGDCVFLMDATSSLDVIDYWNLRAVGWDVMPVPKQVSDDTTVRNLVHEFVEDAFFPLRYNKDFYNCATLLKSRSVSEGELDQFRRDLGVKKPAETTEPKLLTQSWFPRIWDEWAAPKDGCEPCTLEATARTVEISSGERVTVRTLDPEFASTSGYGEARFANVLDLRVYSEEGAYAEVFPDGSSRELARTLSLDFDQWRFSRHGPVYLAQYVDWPIHLNLPKANEVFGGWLRSKGWDAKLSSPGRIATEMLRHIGGPKGTGLVASKGILELLNEMEGGKAVSAEKLRGRMAKISKEAHFSRKPSLILKNLIDSKVVQLGLELQCPTCMQRSWYSLRDADYMLVCDRCLESFRVPSHSPKEIRWSYRTTGPFKLPRRAYGAYSVILTLGFFGRLLDSPVTPLLSFEGTRGEESIEADLALFMRESHFGETVIQLLFAECKTHARFEDRDRQRMQELADEFPGAILVFATLREELTNQEKRLLRPLVNRGRRYWKAEKPYNPVLLLTANELLTDRRPEYTWQDLGGEHARMAKGLRSRAGLLSLCDATQQLYLKMNPWHEWLENRWKQRSGRR